jgi:hypothetical protein
MRKYQLIADFGQWNGCEDDSCANHDDDPMSHFSTAVPRNLTRYDSSESLSQYGGGDGSIVILCTSDLLSRLGTHEIHHTESINLRYQFISSTTRSLLSTLLLMWMMMIWTIDHRREAWIVGCDLM